MTREIATLNITNRERLNLDMSCMILVALFNLPHSMNITVFRDSNELLLVSE